MTFRFVDSKFFFEWCRKKKLHHFHTGTETILLNSLFIVYFLLVRNGSKTSGTPKIYKGCRAKWTIPESSLNASLTVDVFKVWRKEEKLCWRYVSLKFTDWTLNTNCTKNGSINWSVNWIDVELLAFSDFSSVFKCLVFDLYTCTSFGPPHQKLMN